MIYPRPGQKIQIRSYKHDQSLHRVWIAKLFSRQGQPVGL